MVAEVSARNQYSLLPVKLFTSKFVVGHAAWLNALFIPSCIRIECELNLIPSYGMLSGFIFSERERMFRVALNLFLFGFLHWCWSCMASLKNIDLNVFIRLHKVAYRLEVQ